MYTDTEALINTKNLKNKKKNKKKKETAGSDPEMLAWQAVQLQASCPDSIFPPSYLTVTVTFPCPELGT